jgi:hypothetical protein
MTLGKMRANDVRSIAASYWECHHEAVLSADRPTTWRCRSGIVGADARPNWRERPVRLSGAGTAPWR